MLGASLKTEKIELSAVVTKADGTVIDLGVISTKEISIWQRLLQKLVALLRRTV